MAPGPTGWNANKAFSSFWGKGEGIFFFFPPHIKEKLRLHSPILLCSPVSETGSLLHWLSVGCYCTLPKAGFPQGASTGEFQNPSPILSLWSCASAHTPHPQSHFFPPSLRSSSPNTSSSFGNWEQREPRWLMLALPLWLQQHQPFYECLVGLAGSPAALVPLQERVPFPHPPAARAQGSP